MTALRIIIVSALITGAAITAAPLLAEPTSAPDVNVSIVRTADLDLSTRGGQRALDHRLISAASQVCGDASDFDLKGKNDQRQCRNDVLTAARARARTIVAANSGDAIALAARN
jgi:UrcA family protein